MIAGTPTAPTPRGRRHPRAPAPAAVPGPHRTAPLSRPAPPTGVGALAAVVTVAATRAR
ncbi:hypothetical protein [Streptomyces sp.]|uniref:hypothetical protein n=1 Tax=Streptomyces sp. TaxID=1931 RepID=UPI002D61AD05|nr:hypothetical protein [Streptomyces sp.]HZF91215.1 hypothetical protein [Streptomyces sp.]